MSHCLWAVTVQCGDIKMQAINTEEKSISNHGKISLLNTAACLGKA